MTRRTETANKGYNKWHNSVNGTKPQRVTITTISGRKKKPKPTIGSWQIEEKLSKKQKSGQFKELPKKEKHKE